MKRTQIALLFIVLLCVYNLSTELSRRNREENDSPRHVFGPEAYTTDIEDKNRQTFDSSTYFQNLHASIGTFLQGIEQGAREQTTHKDSGLGMPNIPHPLPGDNRNFLHASDGTFLQGTKNDPREQITHEDSGLSMDNIPRSLPKKNRDHHYDLPKKSKGDGSSWCQKAMWQHDVRPGSDWGRLTLQDQMKWTQLDCDNEISQKAQFVQPENLPRCDVSSNQRALKLVAVCCGTTTRKVTNPAISKLALFRYLLPSMAHTVDCGLRYKVVVGYDKGDAFYDTYHGLTQVESWFQQNIQEPLAERGIEIDLHLVKVMNELKKPGPVFNTITKYAYEAGADYIYRVNDDTEMSSPWAKRFIDQLQALGEPYGAVGPMCSQGNTKILTHDFTHRTHMEIFGGEYYPKELVDWWMDDWISRVYGSKRTRQGKSVPVVHHTGAHGQRYQVNKENKKHLERLIKQGKQKILAYSQSRNLDGRILQTISNDRFNGHPFSQF